MRSSKRGNQIKETLNSARDVNIVTKMTFDQISSSEKMFTLAPVKEDGVTEEGAIVESDEKPKARKMDWVLNNYDAESSVPQSLEEELARLQILRSYLILDSEREFPFERLTALASRILDVPIALVSLVDLGRQWFMSNRGLGDVRETPRSQAFCAHAILSKKDIFIINDATKDPRFKENPLVTGAPHIRFYAGAPLIAPEGYKLGTFCVIDTKIRPNGLDLDSKQNLRELSALAVDVLVARRKKREREFEKNSQLIACSAHDLLTPLSGIELSLSLIQEDEEILNKLRQKHFDGMKQASKCSDLLQEICRNVQSTFSQTKSAFEHAFSRAKVEEVKVDELVDKIYAILEPIPKKVPVTIVVDEDVPKQIISDGSKIFRCAMNLLVVSCTRTQSGMVQMKLSVKRKADDKRPSLVVTCEDTGPTIDLDLYSYLFKPIATDLLSERKAGEEERDGVSLELALFSVAGQMDVVGGEFGFQPRNEKEASKATSGPGSVFWFSLPFNEPIAKEDKMEVVKEGSKNVAVSHADAAKFHRTISDFIGASQETPISKNQVVKRQKRALIIEDSKLVRKMLVKSLTKYGFDVVEAENGMVGLEELKNSLFDITLCDFLMPIMDGLDCVQQYREWETIHRPWFKQRIIGISAHASEVDAEKGRSVGMDDFKPKPVTFKDLAAIIETDDQVAASKRLDSITNSYADEGDASSEPERKRLKTSESNGVAGKNDQKNCLIISPPSTSVHMELVEGTIRDSSWQSTTAHSESDAWNMLKMRTWDMILIDEVYVSIIQEFREWESKKRSDRLGNIVLMSEGAGETGPDSFVIPDGLDGVIGKPIQLDHLTKILK